MFSACTFALRRGEVSARALDLGTRQDSSVWLWVLTCVRGLFTWSLRTRRCVWSTWLSALWHLSRIIHLFLPLRNRCGMHLKRGKNADVGNIWTSVKLLAPSFSGIEVTDGSLRVHKWLKYMNESVSMTKALNCTFLPGKIALVLLSHISSLDFCPQPSKERYFYDVWKCPYFADKR